MTHPQMIQKVLAKLRTDVGLKSASLSQGYYYAHLPLAVIDSVFSIGVRYEQVQNAVHHFARRANWQIYRPKGSNYLPAEQEKTISELLAAFTRFPDERTAVELFGNRGRSNPASKNPILKAELVYRVGSILRANGVERFHDFTSFPEPEALESALTSLPSMSSGIVERYLRMLSGSEQDVKPDRHIMAFIRAAVGEDSLILTSPSAAKIIQDAAHILATESGFEHLTPRLVDHAIWSSQRAAPSRDRSRKCVSNPAEINEEKGIGLEPQSPCLPKPSLQTVAGHLEFDAFWDFCVKGGTTSNGLRFSVDDLNRLHIVSPRSANQNYKISKRKVLEYLPQAHDVQFRRNHGWFVSVYDFALRMG